MQGQLLEQWVHPISDLLNSRILSLAVWRGAVFSVGFDKRMIQWTPFAVWSLSSHNLFPSRTREGIKTMMLIASKGYFPSVAFPRDSLMLKCLFRDKLHLDLQTFRLN